MFAKLSYYAAAFGRLCVETSANSPFHSKSFSSRLRAAVC